MFAFVAFEGVDHHWAPRDRAKLQGLNIVFGSMSVLVLVHLWRIREGLGCRWFNVGAE